MPTPSTHEADVERLRVRAAQLEARHGITLEEYSSMFAAQAGRCAVCKEHESSMFRGKRRNLTVDKGPDGRVRGLLCSACHRRMGSFADAQALLDWSERAIDYLVR